MRNRTEWGDAAHALYTIHPGHRVGELQPDGEEVESPWVLGIWNESGDGLALEGDRGELLAFAAALHGFIERESARYRLSCAP